MKRQYTRQQILDILYSANRDIDGTITKFVKGCLDKDDQAIVEAKEHAFSIMNPLQQSISCVIDFIEATEKLLDLLPKYIVRPEPDPCDEWHTERIYHFDLGKDTEVDGYCLSYYNYLYDDELIGFEGALHEVASKMYDWCKANNFLEDK